MGCGCHGKAGIEVTRVAPYEQCTSCAKKHIVKAWNLYNEFTYTEDNLDVITGQLRLAVDHLMYTYRETALYARNLAMIIEQRKFDDIKNQWDVLLQMIRQNFYEDYPHAKQNFELMSNNKQNKAKV